MLRIHRRPVGAFAPAAVVARTARLLAATVLLAGCGATAVTPQPDPDTAPIVAAWQADAIQAGPATVAYVERTCRATDEDRADSMYGGLPLAALDIRGGGSAWAVFSAGARHAECRIGFGTTGSPMVMGAAGVASGDPAIGPRAVVVTASGVDEPFGPRQGFAYGRSGPEIVGVTVITGAGQQIRATVEESWWLAWWPSDDPPATVEGIDASGTVVVTVQP